MSDSPESPPHAAPAPAEPDDDLDPFEFDPVPLRPRLDGWTAERQIAFIQALAESGCVAEACRAVGMSERSAYALRARIDAISFRNAWEAAQDYGIRRLSDAVVSRAINGVEVPIFYRGERIGEKRQYDERLAMFLLRHRDPARYGKWRDRAEWRGHPESDALELNEAVCAIREDADLLADDIPPRFVQRLRELAAKLLRLQGTRPEW